MSNTIKSDRHIYSLGGEETDWFINKVWVDDTFYYFEATNSKLGKTVKCTKEGIIIE